MIARNAVGVSLLVAGSCCLAPPATAQLLDDFESYLPGDLCEQSPWEEFPDRRGMDACGTVANEYAHSGVQSLRIVGDPGGKFGLGDHVVRRVEIFGGLWNYSVWTFVPESATGQAYVMVWSDRDLTHTSLRLRLDADNDVVVSEPGGEALPLLRGRWVQVWADFNLGPQTVSISYDGVALVSNGSWDGDHRIEALSFYAGEPGGGTSGIYLDNVLVYAVDECEPCDANCDGEINAFDIEPFLACLFEACEPCSVCAADMNGDGQRDAFDIEPLLECLFP